jgi:U3 small nucleolar RNA-associated protein 20
MAKGQSTGARKGSGKGKGPSTLRSLRHAASSSSQQKPEKKLRSTANLTVKEQIAKRMSKPLVKGKQFRFQSSVDKMANMRVDLDAVRDRREMLEGEEEAEDDAMHSLFGHALAQSQLINLSLPFVRFSKKVEKWSRSLPLVIHYRRELIEAVCDALNGGIKDAELLGESILEYVVPSLFFCPFPADISHSLQPPSSSYHRHCPPRHSSPPPPPHHHDPPHRPFRSSRRQP